MVVSFLASRVSFFRQLACPLLSLDPPAGSKELTGIFVLRFFFFQECRLTQTSCLYAMREMARYEFNRSDHDRAPAARERAMHNEAFGI